LVVIVSVHGSNPLSSIGIEQKQQMPFFIPLSSLPCVPRIARPALLAEHPSPIQPLYSCRRQQSAKADEG
jgi:hypothetical protein